MTPKVSNCNNIYFYVVDPGAYATISPIVKASPNNVQCYWIAEGYAKQKLNSKGIKTIELNRFLNKKKEEHCNDVVLVLGSQSNFDRTVDTLKACSSLGIKTIFIFDHWCNYGKNFISYDGSMVIPTRILAIDYHVKSKLLSLGINKDRVATIGHPGIEYTVKSAKAIDCDSKNKIRRRLGLGLENNVVFVALELMSIDSNAKLEYGPLLRVIEALKTVDMKDFQLLVRLHPRQNRTKFIDFLDCYSIADDVIVCPETITAAESLSVANVVIGMNSVFLISALALGIATISLKLNSKNFDRKIEVIPYLKKAMVDNPSQLCESISEKLNQRSIEEVSIPMGSVRRAWDEIGKFGPSIK